MNFLILQAAVAKQFKHMTDSGTMLLVTDTDRDVIWDTYINAFPEGTNPIHKKRTEHDCSCCKAFIRQVGNIVTVDATGNMTSIWDVVLNNEPAYEAVAAALSTYVKSKLITGPFLTTESQAGVSQNFEKTLTGEVVKHNHFYLTLPSNVRFTAITIGPRKSEIESKFQVLYRGLTELSYDALETVIELATQNSIYRGAEFKSTVQEFLKLKKTVENLPEANRRNYVWSILNTVKPAVAGLNNSAIGTLLNDLSEGKGLEDSVKSYERKVAPENYKRPTALVTKQMIENAKKTVQELGLTTALSRRFAALSDISINDLLYADRNVKVQFGEVDPFDSLSANASSAAPKNFDKLEEVSIEKFITEFLPTAKSLELFVENRHSPNFVSLIAPTDPSAKPIFKWDNQFSWSYTGDVADSVKERVKKAGGNVTGDVCIRLGWTNHDDLDLHVYEDSTNEHVYFVNRYHKSSNGGQLDVDMNAGGGYTREPVENIVYTNHKTMRPGTYRVAVHQYNLRETTNSGYTVDIDIMGTVHHFSVDKSHRDGQKDIAIITVDAQRNITVDSGTKLVGKGKEMWGVTTNSFVRVSAAMLSPNYWNEQKIGNKHYFFMLDACQNDNSARGFYNEFLRSEMDQHRKVLEMLAGNNKPTIVNDQLSGLGFSATIPNRATFRVTGKTVRTVNVKF